MQELAIIILNYNTYEMTINLVNTLVQICSHDTCKIIVVDNASPNESAEKLQEEANNTQKYVFLDSKINGGYASGNNIGLRYAVKHGYKYSLLLNNDIEIDSYSHIQNMLELMEADKSIGAVSPRIVGKDGKKDPPIYFKKPSFWDLSFGIKYNNRQRYLFDENRNVSIYAPRGSCMLLRNESIERIGFLDESTFLYYEEPILAERLERIGKTCWLCGDSCVIHNHAVTISKAINKERIIKTISDSYEYYLSEYRKFNRIQIAICLMIRKTAIAIRR